MAAAPRCGARARRCGSRLADAAPSTRARRTVMLSSLPLIASATNSHTRARGARPRPRAPSRDRSPARAPVRAPHEVSPGRTSSPSPRFHFDVGCTPTLRVTRCGLGLRGLLGCQLTLLDELRHQRVIVRSARMRPLRSGRHESRPRGPMVDGAIVQHQHRCRWCPACQDRGESGVLPDRAVGGFDQPPGARRRFWATVARRRPHHRLHGNSARDSSRRWTRPCSRTPPSSVSRAERPSGVRFLAVLVAGNACAQVGLRRRRDVGRSGVTKISSRPDRKPRSASRLVDHVHTRGRRSDGPPSVRTRRAGDALAVTNEPFSEFRSRQFNDSSAAIQDGVIPGHLGVASTRSCRPPRRSRRGSRRPRTTPYHGFAIMNQDRVLRRVRPTCRGGGEQQHEHEPRQRRAPPRRRHHVRGVVIDVGRAVRAVLRDDHAQVGASARCASSGGRERQAPVIQPPLREAAAPVPAHTRRSPR